MKHYNIQNYIRYKNDLEQTLKRLAHELKIAIILITHSIEILKLTDFAFYIDSDRTKMKLDIADPSYVKYYLNLKELVKKINKKK